MRIDYYKVMSRAVEEGARYGLRRYYKHRDDAPSEPEFEAMAAAVSEAVMDELCGWFRFDGGDDDT